MLKLTALNEVHVVQKFPTPFDKEKVFLNCSLNSVMGLKSELTTKQRIELRSEQFRYKRIGGSFIEY